MGQVAASQVFNVLTEFRFDIAHAVAGSKTLQSEVGKISSAADQAHFAIQRIGMGLVAQTGLGSGGLVGGLYAAVKAADKFEASQRAIANIMLSNNLFTGPDAFTKAMSEAAISMETMRKAANEFSLPADDLLNFSKLVGATLVSHGLDDSRLGKSIQISRGFLKSAPTLGIDPGLAQGQLLDAVMGRANMGDTLFQRLTNETTPMKGFGGTAGAKAFNALEPAKRVKVLTDALMQFGSNSKIVSENAMSLSAQMQRLKDNITGTFSVLRAIGKAILDPLKKILFEINRYMETNGKKIADILGRVLGDVLKNPEKLFVNIQQIRRLQSDVKKAGNLLALIGLIHGLTAALRFFGFTLSGGLIATALRSLMGGLRWLGAFLFNSGALMIVFRGLSFILTKVFAPLLLLTTIFQAISRGMAKAEVINAKWIADNLVRITEAFENFKTQITAIFAPFEMAIEGLSEIFAWIFRLDLTGGIALSAFEGLNKALEVMGRTIVGLLSIVAGFTNAVMGVLFDLKAGNFKAAYKNLIPNFQEGMTDLYRQYYKPPGMVDLSNQQTAQTKIEIDKIEINNAFKENAEPDRIAFTLKEQLMKAALNPTQAAGRSLSGMAVGN